jgi:hypothetical protein
MVSILNFWPYNYYFYKLMLFDFRCYFDFHVNVITCQISIYYTFIASSLEKFIFWNAKFQISHLVSKHGSIYLNFHKY